MGFALQSLRVIGLGVLAIGTATGAPYLHPQGQPGALPLNASFEVASVKAVVGDSSSFSIETLPGGSLRANNVSVKTLILDAFHLQASQLVQLPTWASSEKFTISAKAGRAASDPELWAMMRSLLEERFQLLAHTEERQGSVYFLELSRADRLAGPKLAAVNRDCSIDSPAPPAAEPLRTSGFCGIDANTGGPRESIRGGGQTMVRLANALGTYAVPRPVIDRTGLLGLFDFTVEWAREQTSGAALTDAVSIFTALQEQLGLRLAAGRGPMQVLVVDNLQRPTPD